MAKKNIPSKTLDRVVNQFDCAFVIDTTGSMGSFIEAAKKNIIDIIDNLSQSADIHLRVGLVEYRDHPPQDQLVSKTYNFTDDMSKAKNNVNKLSLGSGGDMPEAVFDGLSAAKDMDWRPHARKIIILVGDAPPHGVGGSGDAFPSGCPCKQNIASITTLLENESIIVYSIVLSGCQDTKKAFSQISQLTGGLSFESNQIAKSIEDIQSIIKSEFSNIDFDEKILSACQEHENLTMSDLAKEINVDRQALMESVGRLGSKGLLDLAEISC